MDRNVINEKPVTDQDGSLSARRAWIEIEKSTPEEAKRWSLSARRAWIEIWLCGLLSMLINVALRKESVDRNSDGVVSGSGDYVALRKESVDRNYIIKITRTAPRVALRKESVDRNITQFWRLHPKYRRSPQGERG